MNTAKHQKKLCGTLKTDGFYCVISFCGEGSSPKSASSKFSLVLIFVFCLPKAFSILYPVTWLLWSSFLPPGGLCGGVPGPGTACSAYFYCAQPKWIFSNRWRVQPRILEESQGTILHIFPSNPLLFPILQPDSLLFGTQSMSRVSVTF